jgi:hypothetical protein
MIGGSGGAEPVDADAVAEDAVGWLAPGALTDRLETAEAIFCHRPLPHPWFGVVTRVRAADGDAADALIDRSRVWFADRGRSASSWMVGPSATPDDLVERLVAAGAVEESTMTAMVLDREPPPGAADVRIAVVETLDGYRRSMEIVSDAFGFDEETRAAFLADADGAWRFWQTEPGRLYLLAAIDGTAVAEAGLAATIPGPLVLSGGATLAAARGRGAYRSLVRWRWDEAVRRGTPVLVVQASDDSRPILEWLGFRTVGPVRTFLDRF